jgi:hypothetical protein
MKAIETLETLLREWDSADSIADVFNLNVKKKVEQALQEAKEFRAQSIAWSVEDFESQAQINEEANGRKLYDRDQFEYALELMIRKHDANIGISWYTIEYYLDEYCMLKEEEIEGESLAEMNHLKETDNY